MPDYCVKETFLKKTSFSCKRFDMICRTIYVRISENIKITINH